MIKILPPWQKKLLAITLLITTVMVLWSLLIVPMLSLKQQNTLNTEQLLNTYDRYIAIVNNKENYNALIKHIDAQRAPKKLYDNNAPHLLTAQLQSELQTLLSKAGANLQSIQPINLQESNDETTFGTRLFFQANSEAFGEVLKNIVQHDYLLVVDNIYIQAPENQTQNEQPILRIRCDVIGYIEK